MKIKKKHFVLGAMLTTCSLAIVTSITSTFAWYSYNTKNGMAFQGIATGDTEYLQVKLSSETEEDDWRTTLTSDELTADSRANGFADGNLAPVSQAMGITSDGVIDTAEGHNYGFYGSPAYLIPKSSQDTIFDKDGNYTFFRTSIDFRCINPVKENTYFEKNIYISFMDIKATTDDKDITEGLRVHLNQGIDKRALIAPGHDADGTTALTGSLNLAGAEKAKSTDPDPVDQGVITNGKEASSIDAEWRQFIPGYDEETDKKTVTYGNKVGATEGYLCKDSIITKFKDGKVDGEAKYLVGKTRSDGIPISVDITIWLEGWDPVVINKNKGAEFKFGFQFEVETL